MVFSNTKSTALDSADRLPSSRIQFSHHIANSSLGRAIFYPNIECRHLNPNLRLIKVVDLRYTDLYLDVNMILRLDVSLQEGHINVNNRHSLLKNVLIFECDFEKFRNIVLTSLG